MVYFVVFLDGRVAVENVVGSNVAKVVEVL